MNQNHVTKRILALTFAAIIFWEPTGLARSVIPGTASAASEELPEFAPKLSAPPTPEPSLMPTPTPGENKESYIRWVDFNAPAALMKQLIEMDIQSRAAQTSLDAPAPVPFDWIDGLAYLAVKCGGDFSKHKAAHIRQLRKAMDEGKTVAELGAELKTYAYYREAYNAALGGLVGAYEAEVPGESGERSWESRYGLRAFSPIAKGYAYNHYDDFGNGRTYGYRRKHLGHDLMALTGTPVIAVESGVVEELGWNQYGGWRIGIRSRDGLRYWYYAHLRQNRPYAEGLQKGDSVSAGDVIGYVGRTGYSRKENTNGITESHLHWGLQLIFHPSQKDGPNQIWIDLYEITKLLESRRSTTVRDPETKEHRRSLRTVDR